MAQTKIPKIQLDSTLVDSTALATKQNLISLTTTGSTGTASFNQSTGALNIPNYTGSSTTNQFNTVRIDQANGGTTASRGAITGAINGTNTAYTVSNGAYVAGTLELFVQGVYRTLSSTADFVETSPSAGTFTTTEAYPTGTIIVARYVTQTTSTGNLSEPTTVKTADYTVNGSTDKNVYGDTSSNVVILTLPDATAFPGSRFRFKNIGSNVSNLLRLQPVLSQTIDGSPSRTLVINDGIALQSVNGNWQIPEAYYSATRRSLYGQTTVKSGDTIQAGAVAANTYQTFASNYLTGANSLVQGLKLELDFHGSFSTTVAGPSTIASVLLGATELINTGALNLVLGVSNYIYNGKLYLKIQSVGTSGIIRVFGELRFQSMANGQLTPYGFGGDKTFNSTIDNLLTLRAAYTSQTNGNSNTLRDFNVEEVRTPKAAN